MPRYSEVVDKRVEESHICETGRKGDVRRRLNCSWRSVVGYGRTCLVRLDLPLQEFPRIGAFTDLSHLQGFLVTRIETWSYLIAKRHDVAE